jgi:hypothetical protein
MGRYWEYFVSYYISGFWAPRNTSVQMGAEITDIDDVRHMESVIQADVGLNPRGGREIVVASWQLLSAPYGEA